MGMEMPLSRISAVHADEILLYFHSTSGSLNSLAALASTLSVLVTRLACDSRSVVNSDLRV